MHADLISALARLCKTETVRSVYLPVPSLCPFAGSLNPLGLTQVLSFSIALQERVNADQHFDSKSDHEREVKTSFFVINL